MSKATLFQYILLVIFISTSLIGMDQTIYLYQLSDDLLTKSFACCMKLERIELRAVCKRFRDLCSRRNHNLYLQSFLNFSPAEKLYGLLYAIYFHNAYIVKNLLIQNVNLMLIRPYLHTTPLCLAIENGKHTIQKLLLKKNNIITQKLSKRSISIIKNTDPMVPIYVCATYFGDLPSLRLYMQNPTLFDPKYTHTVPSPGVGSINLLHIAIAGGHFCILEQLLHDTTIQTLVNQQGLREMTPLYLATYYNHTDMVALLLKQNNVNPNICNCYNNSPLHRAIANMNIPMVVNLLNMPNINVNSLNHQKITPLDLARSLDNYAIEKMLLAKKAKTTFYVTKILPWQQLTAK